MNNPQHDTVRCKRKLLRVLFTLKNNFLLNLEKEYENKQNNILFRIVWTTN